MIAALLLAASTPAAATPPVRNAVDAEWAFIHDAQKVGQWTAFRKWAHRDAVMFVPQAVWARTFLQDRKDPPKAISWAPAHSFVSCDGRTAVNTGPWWLPTGKPGGFFTTVWQQEKGSWRWVYDGGIPLGNGKPTTPAKAQVHRATCGKAPGAPVPPPPPLSNQQARTTPEDNGRGQSADKTLGWDWKVEKSGARKLRVYMWNGVRYAQVLYNDVPAPPKQ